MFLAEQERTNNLAEELIVLQKQNQTTEKIWSEDVSRLRGQLLVQQQWLPTITAFKLFQTSTIGEFLNRCVKSSKASAITKVLTMCWLLTPA